MARRDCRGLSEAIGFVVVIALVLASPSNASFDVRPETFPGGKAAFCASGQLVRDFGLSRLPPVREIAEKGNLPFGPATVSLAGVGDRILPVGREFGYELLSENQFGRTPLHWTVRARMVGVDRRGERGRVVDHKQVKVWAISSRTAIDLRLYPKRRPGFYLYEVEFLDRNGKLLGRYGQHLKVFGRSYWKARLGLNRHVASPGQRVLSRVENLGTETVSFGEDFYVHRLVGDSWVPVPDATPGIWLRWLGGAGPGASGRCSAWQIPIDFPLGQYRIVKEVGPRPWPNGNRSRYLTAPINLAVN